MHNTMLEVCFSSTIFYFIRRQQCLSTVNNNAMSRTWLVCVAKYRDTSVSDLIFVLQKSKSQHVVCPSLLSPVRTINNGKKNKNKIVMKFGVGDYSVRI